MTEQKLRQVAGYLPVPNFSYEEMKARAKKRYSPAPSPRRFYRLCAIFAALFILAGCTTWAATTNVSYGAWTTHSSNFRDVEYKTEKLDIVLPEVLDNSPFSTISTAYVVPHGTTYLEALISPVYRWHSVSYTGSDSSAAQPKAGHMITVNFGSTENELWRYCFEYNTDGIWSPDGLVSGSYQAEEYKGRLLQFGTTEHYSEYYAQTTCSYSVHWADEASGVCFSIWGDADLDVLLEYAKYIIDLHP